MYYTYFGLTQPPFKITPNTEFFFSGGNRGAILDALIYAINHGEGMIKVSGEVGSGKTMLCRMLQARLPEAIERVYLANPSVSPEEILHALAFELQLPIAQNAPRLEVMQALHRHLMERHAQKRQVVIFVEESQSMPLATLEEMRLLSNLETGSHKLLQIVLFGQPELDEILRKPEIRQLRERITYSFSLGPLKVQEIRDYLMFRLRAAGYHGPDLFAPNVLRLIAKVSNGLTRRVTLLADKCMLAAFADDTHTIKLKHVRAAIADSEFSSELSRRSGTPVWAWLGCGIALGVVLYWMYLSLLASPAAPPASAAVAQNKPAVAEPARAPVAPPPAAATAPEAVVEEKKTGLSSPLPAAKLETSTNSKTKTQPQQIAKASVESYPLLQQRINAAQAAFAQADPGNFTLQLFLTDDERPPRIERFLTRAEKMVNVEDIYVYPVRIGGLPRYRVFYGFYPGWQEASAAMKNLPSKYAETFKLKVFPVGDIRN
ncbi:MAG: ExeA family protein [Burkholderiales bacterium]